VTLQCAFNAAYDASYADYLRVYEEFMAQKASYDRYRALADDLNFIFMVAKHEKSQFT
jgi:hypothetical protein